MLCTPCKKNSCVPHNGTGTWNRRLCAEKRASHVVSEMHKHAVLHEGYIPCFLFCNLMSFLAILWSSEVLMFRSPKLSIQAHT